MDTDQNDKMSSGGEEDTPSRKGRDAGVPWDLQMDAKGWPILPLELTVPLPQLKEILRSFLTITYRELVPNPLIEIENVHFDYREHHKQQESCCSMATSCWQPKEIHFRWIPSHGCAHPRTIQDALFRCANTVSIPPKQTDMWETSI